MEELFEIHHLRVVEMLAHKNVARYYYCSSVNATKLNSNTVIITE